MTVERAAGLLRRMGWEHNWPKQDVIGYTLAELTKRKDVMKRVVKWVNKTEDNTRHYWMVHPDGIGWSDADYHTITDWRSRKEFLTQAIELGMTDDELLGVE